MSTVGVPVLRRVRLDGQRAELREVECRRAKQLLGAYMTALEKMEKTVLLYLRWAQAGRPQSPDRLDPSVKALAQVARAHRAYVRHVQEHHCFPQVRGR